jgi:hypothetical protein
LRKKVLSLYNVRFSPNPNHYERNRNDHAPVFQEISHKASQIAQRLGYSLEWLAGLYSGRTLYTKPVKEKYIKNINQLINEIGREMAIIKFTDEL